MKGSLQVPVLVLGGGTGGVAAALTLAEQGVRCVVTEPTGWLGGQLTSQGVPPDENQWIEAVDGVTSATRSYLHFRERVRAYYKQHEGLTAQAKADVHLNPGGGWVSRLCFSPRIGERLLMEMLRPHIELGMVQVLLKHEPVSAATEGDRVAGVTLRDLIGGELVSVVADYILEATETGELYPLAGIEHVIGAEHRDTFGELHGRDDRDDPMDQQAISWCFAVEHRPDEDHVIEKPENYNFWASYVPPLDKPWPGPLMSWTICGENHKPRDLAMTPWPDEPGDGQWELWRYRRIVDRSIYEDADSAPPDVSLMNCVQMDYFLKPLLGVDEAEQHVALEAAREQSLCWLYWMQTQAPRHDGGGPGYPGLKLRGDELGTEDGFAMAAYIREPRRLKARTVVTEAHVGQAQRLGAGHRRLEGPVPVAAEPFDDSVGIGHYPIDLHPSTAMRNSIYIPAAPFRIPLGALLPVRASNVIAAGKAIGVTHITNGCTRLHPIEWNVGESAGALAAYCLQEKRTPTQVHTDTGLLRDYQARLREIGVPLAWPWEDV